MLKPLNLSEVESIAVALKPFIGARLQEVRTSEELLGLGFYNLGQMVWFLIDMKVACPFFIITNEFSAVGNAKQTPMLLFLRAHFLGHRLQGIEMPYQEERILQLVFLDRTIEVRLIPHASNIIAEVPEKKISWNKNKELKERDRGIQAQYQIRKLEEMKEQWLETRKKTKDSARDPKKAIEKKKRAIEELQKSLLNNEILEMRQRAKQLQALNEFELAEELFEQIKKIEQKKGRTLERFEILKKEITELESGQLKKEKSVIENTLSKVKSEGRRIVFLDKYELLIGKTAKDNLNILRKASPYDLWLHLKDYPGAHGIIRINKGKKIENHDLMELAQRFIQESKPAKRELRQGDLVEVLVVECRFVRPIKGDKLGRVHYQNESVFRIKYQEK